MRLPLVVEQLLEEIAQSEGFSNYKFEQESGSGQGDNYQGVMITIKLVGDRVKDGAVTNESLDLICKVTPESKERCVKRGTQFAFEREIRMYSRVLPTFVKFQQEKGLTTEESFLSFPKVYAWKVDKVNETYAIVMEDVRPKQFVMWPRRDPIDLAHEKLLFTQLGRFHGVSLALKDQRPDVFAEFKQLNDIITVWIEIGAIGDSIVESIDLALNVLENGEHKNVIKHFRNDYLDTWKSFFTKESVEKFGVVGHGDLWINNLMFQYTDNTNELKDLCFLDFQLSRYGSPALDVLQHFFTSTRKALRDQSYNELLNVHHTALSDTVRKLGSDPEQLFSFADFQAELKAYGKFALIMGVWSQPFVHFGREDIVDIKEYGEQLLKGDTAKMFTTDGRGNATYVQAVNELVADIISYGYDYDSNIK